MRDTRSLRLYAETRGTEVMLRVYSFLNVLILYLTEKLGFKEMQVCCGSKSGVLCVSSTHRACAQTPGSDV